MRIAVVHSFYRSEEPSGENIVVKAQSEALARAGHEVILLPRSSDDLTGSFAVATSVVSNVMVGRGHQPKAILDHFRPEAILVHNLFPRWPDYWMSSAQAPVLRFLHNYRTVCAAGTLVRDGAYCQLCVESSSAQAVKNGCYRGSRIQSIPLAISARQNGRRHREARGVHFVAHSDRAAALFEAFGWESSSLSVIPNFCKDPGPIGSSVGRVGWCSVGRLTREKGILELVESWDSHEMLTVLGDGPLMPEVRRAAEGRNVNLIGHGDAQTVKSVLASSRGHLFPSLSPEGAIPLVYMEALGQGTPTIAVRGNGAADHIAVHQTGLVVDSIREMSDVLDQLAWGSSERQRARAVLESDFSEGVWVDRLEFLISRLRSPDEGAGDRQ